MIITMPIQTCKVRWGTPFFERKSYTYISDIHWGCSWLSWSTDCRCCVPWQMPKNRAGKSAVYDGEGDEKKYRSFGKRWKGLNSASNYKRQQFVTCNSPLSVIKCEQDFLAPWWSHEYMWGQDDEVRQGQVNQPVQLEEPQELYRGEEPWKGCRSKIL